MTHANKLSTHTTAPTTQAGRTPAPLSRQDPANCIRVLAMDAVQHAFSYARALQESALSIWKGDNAYANKAQAVRLQRANCNSDAARAGYDPKLDRNAA